ncbi:MAG: hypothetical protein MUF84_00245 [Anaerolineae bacterium]|nr:hypothetical protein [Anaerolineae bacterium]
MTRVLRTFWLLAISLLLMAGCTWLESLPLNLSGISTATLELTPMPSPPASSVDPFETPAATAIVPTDPGEATPPQGNQMLSLQLWVPDFLNPNVDTAAAAALSAQVSSFVGVAQNVQVQVVAKSDTGAGSVYALISTAYDVAPSILPDVVVMNQHDIIAAADAGLLQSLSSALPVDAGFFPTALRSVTTDQAVWAFPYVAKAEHLAYAVDAVPVDEVPPIAEGTPTTEGTPAPEVTSIAEGTPTAVDVVTAPTTLPLSWMDVISGNYQMLFPAGPADGLAGDALLSMYLGSGGRAMDQGGQPTLDRAILERVYTFFSMMRDSALLDAEVALSLSDAAACWELYQTGVGELTPVPAGMYWQSLVARASAGEAPPDIPLPRQTLPSWAPTVTGDPITIMRVWGLAVVTQDPARREAALGLVRWLVSAQHMADVAYAATLMPTRGSAIEAWPIDPEVAAVLSDLLTKGVPVLPPTVDAPVRRALQAGLTGLLQQDVDSPEAAASLALTVLRR